VLNNLKLSSKKYVAIPHFEPQSGLSLNLAMAIEDAAAIDFQEQDKTTPETQKTRIVLTREPTEH